LGPVVDVFRTVNGGLSWFSDSAGLIGAARQVSKFSLSPDFPSDGLIFAGTAAGLYVDPKHWVHGSTVRAPEVPLSETEEESVCLAGLSCVRPGASEHLNISFVANREPSRFVITILSAAGDYLYQEEIKGVKEGSNNIHWQKNWGVPPAGARLVLSAYGAPWSLWNIEVPYPEPGFASESSDDLDAAKLGEIRPQAGSLLPAGKKLIGFPNPAKDVLNFAYRLEHGGRARLDLSGLAGEGAGSMDLGSQGAGEHTGTMLIPGLPSGIYFAVLSADEGMGMAPRARFKLAVVK
jgi:hypothetical protein